MATAPAPPAVTANVLIVEDDPGIAELERLRLEEAGYRVVLAATAEDALRVVGRGGVDLVLLDYRLPGGVDGLEFYARVKAAGYDLPVILVTGFGNEATVIQALRIGVRDFVTKSVEYLDYLPEAVDRVLRQVGTERRLAESEARLAGIIGSARDAVIVLEADRRVSLFNPAAELMFACPAAAASGRPVTDFIPDEAADGPGWVNDSKQGSAAPLRIGPVGVRTDGTRFPLEATVSPGRAGGRRFYTVLARDVTARRIAEEDLRRSEARFRTVVEQATDAIYLHGEDGVILDANRRACEGLGYAREELRGVGIDRLDSLTNPTRGAWIGESMLAGRQITYESRHRRKDQTTFPVEVRLGPIELDGRRIFMSVARDITERRRLTAERDELLARLQVQIERMPLAYVLFDAAGRVIDWNPAAERTFGFAKADVLGMEPPYEKIVPPDEVDKVRDLLTRVRAGDMAAHSVNRNRTKDGRTIVCEWINTPLVAPDGGFGGHLSLAQDVTERRTAEATLRLQDRAIRAVTQGIVITDPALPDNPIIYVSPGFEALTGYTAAEVQGKNCRFLQGNDTHATAVAKVRLAAAAGQPCTVELLNYRKDGSPFWNELSISPVRESSERPVPTNFVGVLTDVTQRRKLEDQFRQAQKMEAVGQLAGGVAHDFNNLLTVINGYSDLLSDMTPPTDPSQVLLGEIKKAGERSAGLTRQLLAFSRQQVLAPKVLDLNAVVSDTVNMLRRLIGEDIRLTLVPSAGLWPVKADPGLIEQVLMNLAVNARDAMPRGGRLTIETENVRIDESHVRNHPEAAPGPYVLLAVSDTGTGMTADVKARIFEPFFTTKAPGKGTGLGLATVYGIVRQSGGLVDVYSEVGVGTTFKIYVPRVGGSPSVADEHRAAPTEGGTETILIVEDEDGVRSLAKFVLSGRGYRVLEAADESEALKVSDNYSDPIHLLISDVVMPGVGGQMLAEQLVRRRPALKVVFVSGYTDDAVVRHGILHDKVHFLQKPFSPAALSLKVRTVLDA